MNADIHALDPADFPTRLLEIPQPPQQLRYRGQLPPPELKLLTVVGSRKYTTYGKEVIDYLIGGLRGYRIGIVSGLALGIDSLAHESALANNLYTLAIPGSGLGDSVLYPAKHKKLAQQIIDAGGGLLSEYDDDTPSNKWTFPERNRLVAGISHATLLVEAAEQSGTLITARLATDYNRELLVVPGNIFSKSHAGIHQFLKLGATPVTTSEDILDVLQIDHRGDAQPTLTNLPDLTPDEQTVLANLHEPLSRDELTRACALPVAVMSGLLMQMELAGHIVESGGKYRAAR
jgi:DNA processing protein